MGWILRSSPQLGLTILQWNIWYKEDIRNIAAFLKAHPADIICLQELTRGYQKVESDTIAYIAKVLGYDYHFQEMPGESSWTQANAIFSKFPIVAKRSEWINEPTGAGGYDDEYRCYIEVNVDVNGKELTIGTTHMSYTHGFQPTARKTGEAERLAKLLSRHKRNFIFTGDLNAAPDSPTVRSISKILRNASPTAAQNTWTTKPFSYDGFEETELSWQLDYVFTTDDIRIINTEVLKTEFSDHLPVRARIGLP